MSFFDDDEETAPRPTSRAPRQRPASDRPATGAPRARGRAVLRARDASGPDQRTLMVRRLAAAGVAVVVVIVIALVINGCAKAKGRQALKTYNREVGQLGHESDEQVAHPLFAALTNATGKSALDVEQQVDELLTKAQTSPTRAKGLSVPGEMASAQQNLLLAMDLRVEGMTKLAALLPTALGGKAKQAST